MYHNNYIFIKTIRETKTPRNAEESFYYFIENSKIRFVSYNSDKFLLFNCFFDKNENLSPYFYLNVYGEMENVTVICIKLSFICENRQPNISFVNRQNPIYDNKNNPEIVTQYITPYNFFKENCRQCEISEAGITNLTRNTQIILFSKLYENKSRKYKNIYKILCKNINKRHKAYLNQLFKDFNNIDNNKMTYKYYFSITCMEYINIEYYRNCYDVIIPIIDGVHSYVSKKYMENMENMENMEKYNEKDDEIQDEDSIEIYNNVEFSKFSERLKLIYNIARYEIIMIAINTGYSQGDYHIENLFLYEDMQTIMVTDFGNVKHIPNYQHIQNAWSFLQENEFKIESGSVRIFKEILEDIYSTHFQDEDANSKHYKWLKNIDQEDVTIIYSLHSFRKYANLDSRSSIFEMYLNARRSEYIFNNVLEIDTKTTNTLTNCISYLFCQMI